MPETARQQPEEKTPSQRASWTPARSKASGNGKPDGEHRETSFGGLQILGRMNSQSLERHAFNTARCRRLYRPQPISRRN